VLYSFVFKQIQFGILLSLWPLEKHLNRQSRPFPSEEMDPIHHLSIYSHPMQRPFAFHETAEGKHTFPAQNKRIVGEKTNERGPCELSSSSWPGPAQL
jgi:hypothetical protein